MTSKTQQRGRVALLASSSLVSAGIAILGAGFVAIAPGSALAANECGNPAANGAAADNFICVGGTYATGIQYPLTAGPLTLTLDDGAGGAVVTTTGGIQVIGTVGDTVLINRSSTVTGNGDPVIVNTAGAGILVSSPTSNVTVNLTDSDGGDAPISVTGSTSGIIANAAGAGNANVTLSNGSVVGQAGAGIIATAGVGGSATVNLGAATVTSNNVGVGLNSYAVIVSGGTGMTVTGTGNITANAGNYAIGVYASGNGPIVINETGTITANATYGWGVYARGTSGGTIQITTANIQDLQVGGAVAGGKGISAYTTGAVTINSGTIRTTGVGADGINVGGVFGIAGTTIVGSTSITTNGANADGIVVGAHGTIQIGSTNITTTGATADGIRAVSDLNSVSIGLAVGGSTNATGAGSAGVRASGVTGTSVTANGSITANTNAIATNQTGVGSGVINIGAAAVVRGGGTTLTTATLDLTTLSGQTTTINNAGIVRSTNATVAGAAGDLAVRGLGGNATINNTGRIDGRVNFAGLTGINKATVGVTSTGSWHTTGINTLSAGNDVINNAGLISTFGATTIDFGADTGVAPRDVFNNSGRLATGEAAGASTLTITGLETFNNSGSVIFGSLNGTSSDGETNDRIVMTGTGGGTAFVGSGASTLILDANLGSAAQASCAAASVADCLSLPGGTVSGSTAIRVNNTNVGPGGLNTAGIVLVDATGGSIGATSFVLDTGSSNYVTRGGQGGIDTGFFVYRLVRLGTTQEALVSAPDSEAFEFVQLGAAATDAWYATTGAWFDRQADLRNTVGNLSDGTHSAVWMKIIGQSAERDSSQTYNSLGTPFTFDTSYQQNTSSLIGGVDLLGGGSGGHNWVIGVNIGYVDTDIDFNQSATVASLEGPTYGVYGSMIAGPWYVDASVNSNMLDMTYTMPSLGAGVKATGSVKSTGVRAETGYRFGLGDTLFIEPMASIAAVKTSFDDLTVPGGSVKLDDVNSLRGSLGVRVGTLMTYDTFRLQPSIYGRVWDETKGDSQTTLNNPGLPLVATDSFSGTFGDVGGQLSVYSDGGLSAFVNVGYKWNSDYRDTTANVGFRFQW